MGKKLNSKHLLPEMGAYLPLMPFYEGLPSLLPFFPHQKALLPPYDGAAPQDWAIEICCWGAKTLSFLTLFYPGPFLSLFPLMESKPSTLFEDISHNKYYILRTNNNKKMTDFCMFEVDERLTDCCRKSPESNFRETTPCSYKKPQSLIEKTNNNIRYPNLM